jgi:hypothetical protein
LAIQPRVVQEALDLSQPKPVGRLAQQPGRDSAAAVLLEIALEGEVVRSKNGI